MTGIIGIVHVIYMNLQAFNSVMVKVVIEFDLDKAKDRRVYRRVTKSLTPYRGKDNDDSADVLRRKS